MLDVGVFCSVLQNAGRLVDDPVGAEDREDQPARHAGHVNTHVHSQLFAGVAAEADREELWHVWTDLYVAVPVTALVLYQHQFHDLSANRSVQDVGRAALLQLMELG